MEESVYDLDKALEVERNALKKSGISAKEAFRILELNYKLREKIK